MPEQHAALYIKSLRLTGRFKKARECIQGYQSMDADALLVKVESAELHMARKSWQPALGEWSAISSLYADAAYRMSGEISKAMDVLLETTVRIPASLDEWILKGNLAQLNEKWDIAVDCWIAILKDFADEAPEWVWGCYQSSQLLCNGVDIKVA